MAALFTTAIDHRPIELADRIQAALRLDYTIIQAIDVHKSLEMT